MAEKGTVKFFSSTKGWGFLERTEKGGKDVFVHHTAIDMEGYRELAEGDEVEFDVVQGQKGLQAENVRKLHK